MTAANSAALPAQELISNYSACMRKHLKRHMDGANINHSSLLTTDYLNHYSSMVMLLEQLPETPEELIIYLLSWEPLSYEEHFETSGFREGNLAIRAYRHAPEEIRASFDHIISRLHEESLKALNLIRAQAENGDTSALSQTCEQSAPLLRELIDEAAAIVNQQKGEKQNQDMIDEMF